MHFHPAKTSAFDFDLTRSPSTLCCIDGSDGKDCEKQTQNKPRNPDKLLGICKNCVINFGHKDS